VFYVITVPTEEKMLGALKEANANNARLLEENKQLKHAAETAIGAGQRLLAAQDESTVLYETAPRSELAGIVTLISGRQMPQQQGMIPKWFIPSRVVPIVAASDAPNVRVIYLDKDGRQRPGAPDILPQ
jgi:hypothetical protein